MSQTDCHSLGLTGSSSSLRFCIPPPYHITSPKSPHAVLLHPQSPPIYTWGKQHFTNPNSDPEAVPLTGPCCPTVSPTSAGSCLGLLPEYPSGCLPGTLGHGSCSSPPRHKRPVLASQPVVGPLPLADMFPRCLLWTLSGLFLFPNAQVLRVLASRLLEQSTTSRLPEATEIYCLTVREAGSLSSTCL